MRDHTKRVREKHSTTVVYGRRREEEKKTPRLEKGSH